MTNKLDPTFNSVPNFREETPSQDPSFLNAFRERPVRSIVFTLALMLTFAQGSYLWLARIGWTLIAILQVFNRRYMLYSAFFFSAWFVPSGFLMTSVFTLKHFHIAVLLGVVVDFLKGDYRRVIWAGLNSSQFLVFVYAIIGIGLVRVPVLNLSFQALRTPLNLFFILGLVTYLLGMLRTFHAEQFDDILCKSMTLFLCGIAAQTLLSLYNGWAGTSFLELHLIHNNHIGMLSAIGILYAISFLLAAQTASKKVKYLMLSLILFIALVGSCSRTSWLSFLIGFVFFVRYVRSYTLLPKNFILKMTIVFAAAGGALLFLIMEYQRPVFERVISLPQLIQWDYIQYTLRDRQNFGFLGRFRLDQIVALGQYLRSHLLFGEGFIKAVVDFHGFYFCILGATGIAGLLLFGGFIRQTIRASLDQMKYAKNLMFLRIAALCSFIVWLFCSFMESYFVQFAPWVTVMVLLVLIPLKNSSKAFSQ